MATSPAVQVDPASLDTAGVSLATTPPDLIHPRRGSAYDLTGMAAAAPVWFHPIADGRVLMLNSSIWTAATPVGGNPGAFSAHTTDTAPSWFLLDGPTGTRLPVPGASVHIPMNTPASGISLVAAASRPPNLLFLLNAVTGGSVLQRLHIHSNTSVTIANEEVLAPIGNVVFDKGMQYNTPYLLVYGADTTTHQVYRIKKPWGRVGFNTVRNVGIPKRTGNDLIGSALGWEFFTGTGYSSDASELAPVLVAGGSPLTTYGPMSFALYRNQVIMTTVNRTGTSYSGQFWVSKSGQSFAPTGSPLPLGDSSDGSYLGGGIQLMPQLGPNSDDPTMTATGVLSGVPYVISTRTGSSGSYTLNTAWNIHPIRA